MTLCSLTRYTTHPGSTVVGTGSTTAAIPAGLSGTATITLPTSVAGDHTITLSAVATLDKTGVLGAGSAAMTCVPADTSVTYHGYDASLDATFSATAYIRKDNDAASQKSLASNPSLHLFSGSNVVSV